MLYDFRSAMHYGSKAFGSGELTIRTKDHSKQDVIGKVKVLITTNIKQIKLMYCN